MLSAVAAAVTLVATVVSTGISALWVRSILPAWSWANKSDTAFCAAVVACAWLPVSSKILLYSFSYVLVAAASV